MSLGALALRALLTYLFLWAILRAAGKHALSEANTLDVIVAFVLGDTIDDFVWAEVAANQWLVAIGTLLGLHTLISAAQIQWPRLERWLEGEPGIVVCNGRVCPDALRRHRLSIQELDNELRVAGVDDLASVKCARIEVNGRLSLERYPPPWRRLDL